MAHDVFISHAHKDKGIAEAICEKLEAGRIRCWIAERDISAGDDWTEATRSAIGSSRVMVLVLSENANVAPHIEREIAHAFYTGRIIIPLRLTNTPPRRDFLFYLGNVCWFDACSLPPEQHLEAFAASVHGMVRGPSKSDETIPQQGRIQAAGTFNSSDPSTVARADPRSGTREILKCVSIAASLLAVVWLWKLAPWQPKDEVSLAERDRAAISPVPDAPLDPMPRTTVNEPSSKPGTASAGPASWAAPNILPVPLDLQGSLNPPPARSVPPLVDANPSPHPGEAGEAESVRVPYHPSGKSEQEDAARIVNRREAHRRRARTKRRARRVRPSDGSVIAHVKSELETIWREIVTGTREPSNH